MGTKRKSNLFRILRKRLGFPVIFKDYDVLIVTDKGTRSFCFSAALQRLTIGFTAIVLPVACYGFGKYQAWSEQKIHSYQTLQQNYRKLERDYIELRDSLKALDQYLNTMEGTVVPSAIQGMGPAQLQSETESLITKIHYKMEQKVHRMESIVTSTGLKLDQLVTYPSHTLTSSPDATTPSKLPISISSEEESAQGGPYVSEQKKSLLNTARITRIRNNAEYMEVLNQLVSALPVGLPIEGARISSGFGPRTDPFMRRPAVHEGVDLVGDAGSTVYSTAKGVVSYTGWRAHYGRTVEIDHGFGLRTRYGHLNKILVKHGEQVRTKDSIAIQGNTGRSTGAHLHYEVLLNDVPYNPLNFLRTGYYYQLTQ